LACVPEEWVTSAQGRGWETARIKGENTIKNMHNVQVLEYY
jgi:hypothetical protein